MVAAQVRIIDDAALTDLYRTVGTPFQLHAFKVAKALRLRDLAGRGDPVWAPLSKAAKSILAKPCPPISKF